MNIRILQPADKEAVMAFARARLPGEGMEREMLSWNARWRAEALDHYLPQGWSFAVFNGAELKGIILAQPLLFYRGLTQTLWVEHLEAVDAETEAQLLDTATRWARDKHFQCVLREGPSGWIETKTARY